MAKNFEVGKTYYDRSACDHDTIFAFKIMARSEKTVRIRVHGKTVSRRVSVYADVEQFKPFGSYSMCAIVRADHEQFADLIGG